MSIASRFLVFLPNNTHIGISQRIEDEEERSRLHDIVRNVSLENEGFIVRTAAEGASCDDVVKDVGHLRAQWHSIQEEARFASSSTLIYEDLPLPLRVMRDIINSETTSILVDDEETYKAVSNPHLTLPTICSV